MTHHQSIAHRSHRGVHPKQSHSKAMNRPKPVPAIMDLVHRVGNQAMGRMLQNSVVQRIPDDDASQSVDSGPLFAEVSPIMARALGSETIDGFVTGKADVSDANKEKLKSNARYILGLLHQYPGSWVTVEGHTDAVGTDERNASLGQERADSTATVLTSFGVKSDIITKVSKGESELKVKTGKAEARNRRAEVIFKPYVMPGYLDLKLDTSPPSFSGLGTSDKSTTPYMPNEFPTTESPLFGPRITPGKPQIKNWLEEGLKRDKLIHLVPSKYRDKVVNALKDGDEKLADFIIDKIPLDSKYKAAVKAVVKSVLQLAKGKTFKMPPDKSWRQSPFESPEHSPFKPYKAPGEKIFTYDLFKW